MRRASPVFPLLLALCLPACASMRGAAATDPAPVRAAIERANAGVVQALRAGDAAAAAAYFAPDALLLPAGMEPVRGRDGVRALYAGLLSAFRLDELSITTQEVEVYGATAYEMGTNATTISAPGQPSVHDRGKYIVVWKRQPDGAWRIWRDIQNSSVPAGPR